MTRDSTGTAPKTSSAPRWLRPLISMDGAPYQRHTILRLSSRTKSHVAHFGVVEVYAA